MDQEPPFLLSEQDAHLVQQNRGFRVVRAFLGTRDSRHSFCSSHTSTLDQSSKNTFVFQRDIIHALLLPLLQIHTQAASFATEFLARQPPRSPLSPLSSRRSSIDLEVAFRGAARGAFAWLQCFITEERDWCSTKGCPGCVVSKVLHSEPFIRIVVAACRLSGYLKDISLLQDDRQLSQETGSAGPGVDTSPLPEIRVWIHAVQKAVSHDEFWGSNFWEEMEAKAKYLEQGVEELVRQCCSEGCLSPEQQRALTEDSGSVNQPLNALAEQRWTKNVTEACWLALVQERAPTQSEGSRLVASAPGDVRMRSLTA